MTRILFLLTCIFCAAISWADGENAKNGNDVNLALGKKYTLSPAPNYKLCTDAEDKIQLTDGKVTASYFWTQTGTVGWVHTKFPTITVDLEKVEPIGRVEFTTAAGKAGVTPPLAVFVQVSDDGKEYREVCDIMAEDATLNGLFPETYVIRALQTKPLNVRGRYIRFVCVPGTFCFCDEIRIFRGNESCLDRVPSGEIVVSPEATVNRFRVGLLMGKRIRTDISMITEAVEKAEIGAETKTVLKERLAELGKLPIPEIDQETFTTVFPMSNVHREIYGIQSALWRALECEKVTVKAATLWDPVDRFAIPKMVPNGELNVHLMQNETRAVAFNVYNASEKKQSVSFKLPNFAGMTEVEVYYAPWTDSSNAWSSASALVPLEVKNGVFSVPAQSGLVTQVWLRVKACKNGEMEGDSAKDS
ncbi:MAG: discoidin domain-containing protein, partial [Planctomycetia bacterium]|nr:discoidin domain-containing protein [Planctomycetia bacterium]